MIQDCLTSFAALTSGAANEKPGLGLLEDLDDDHIPDLIAASTTGNSVQVRKGNGDGTFGTATTLAVSALPGGMAVADLNQDRRQDLIVTLPSLGQIKIFLGNGNLTFQTTLAAIAAGASPVAVAVGHFNSDFAPDLVVANNLTPNGKVNVLLRGATATPTSVSYGAPIASPDIGSLPRALAVGDWDRDGDDDLVVVNESGNSLTVFNNSGIGTGTFTAGPTYTTGTQPAGVTAADLNMDGFVDLSVAIKGQSRVDVFLGLGNGKFAFSQFFTTAAQPVSIAVGHLDNNAKPDLIVACASGTVSRLRSNQYRLPEIVTFATPASTNIHGALHLKTQGVVEPMCAKQHSLHIRKYESFSGLLYRVGSDDRPVRSGRGGRGAARSLPLWEKRVMRRLRTLIDRFTSLAE